jgi:large subunit ribosomal protein L35
MKTHKGLSKRLKISARGKVKYKKGNMNHIMSGTSGKRRRRLSQRGFLANPAMARKFIRALGG